MPIAPENADEQDDQTSPNESLRNSLPSTTPSVRLTYTRGQTIYGSHQTFWREVLRSHRETPQTTTMRPLRFKGG